MQRKVKDVLSIGVLSAALAFTLASPWASAAPNEEAVVKTAIETTEQRLSEEDANKKTESPSSPAVKKIPVEMLEDNDIGFLNLNYNGISIKANDYAYDTSGGTLGFLSLAWDDISGRPQVPTQAIPSDAAKAMQKDLEFITKLHQNADWPAAARAMRAMFGHHPDVVMLGKWTAIYQDRAKDFEGTLATIAQLREAYPMDKEVRSAFIYDYYVLDALRNLKEEEQANALLKLMREKVEHATNRVDVNNFHQTLSNAVATKGMMRFLLDYQQFMLKYQATGEVDRPMLDKLWADIPSLKQRNLDRFHGFDLSELGYVYGMYYERKDILNAYVIQKKFLYDADTVAKVRAAKRVIYGEE